MPNPNPHPHLRLEAEVARPGPRLADGRYRGDTGEVQGRYRGDTGEVQGRYRGDAGEVQGRSRRALGPAWRTAPATPLVGSDCGDGMPVISHQESVIGVINHQSLVTLLVGSDCGEGMPARVRVRARVIPSEASRLVMPNAISLQMTRVLMPVPSETDRLTGVRADC